MTHRTFPELLDAGLHRPDCDLRVLDGLDRKGLLLHVERLRLHIHQMAFVSRNNNRK